MRSHAKYSLYIGSGIGPIVYLLYRAKYYDVRAIHDYSVCCVMDAVHCSRYVLAIRI